MAGEDKGLLMLNGEALIAYSIRSLRPQVQHLLINANRNLARYRQFGHPVITDTTADFAGPLAGISVAMQAARTPYILCVPCDAPLLPEDLAPRLWQAMKPKQAAICAAHDGDRLQPLFALLKRELFPNLRVYLTGGKRKVEDWYAEHGYEVADFSEQPEAFANLNTKEECLRVERQLLSNP